MKRLIPVIPLLLFLLAPSPSPGQKRLLVSPYGDAIPIGKGKAAAEILKERMNRRATSSPMVCSDKATFGYSADDYPNPQTNHIGFHKDIMAMWYVAPASGTIDTVFWWASDVGSEDSTVTLRLFESNIYPGSGPGYGGYPKPGRLCWGYFINTNDNDNGIAAFPEDATDPTWYSTVSGAIPSFTPMGDEIWGFGGAPVVEEANAVNSYPLGILGEPNITVGDPFFITIRIYGPHVPQAEEQQTGFLATNEADSMSTHNWKFYEHIVEIQPGFTCPGWVARGDFNILFWYSMTVTTNIPPSFDEFTAVRNTFSTAPQVVQATIIDCDPGTPLAAGVKSASLRYSQNGGPPTDVPMTYLGTDTWEAALPGGAVNDEFTYRIVAVDSADFADSTASTSYRIVPFGTESFSIDTGYACTVVDISGSGTPIDTADFFVPTYSGSGTAPADDGTAGPFDMGDDYVVFGDHYRYAWVGVNGAIALSKGATDTIDVNANGFATTGWDIPFSPQHHNRADTVNTSGMPPMFVAPMWADHIVGDTTAQFGRILVGNAGDSCLFITQWDSVGAFDTDGSVPDITTFRVILNRCTGVVEYQYESVGTFGLDSAALVGMQADSNAVSGAEPGWVFFNRLGYPAETRPYDGMCVRFYPKVGTVANDGWNIVAVSLTPNNAVYSKAALFPTATSSAYRYAAGYQVADPLAKGEGYWLKFSGDGGVGNSPATFDHEVTATVADKWNLFGGPSGYVPTSSINAVGGTVASSYFGYGTSGYFTATQIQPGKGYWVKMNGAGTLEMASWGAAPKATPAVVGETDLAELNRVTVTDATGRSQSLYLGGEGQLRNELSFYELPPAPPAGSFDVRFGSQRMVEGYTDGSSAEFPIAIQGAAYPVIVSWEINAPVKGARKMVLADLSKGASGGQVMEGVGSVMLKGENAKNVGIRISEGVGVPATFALSQNYPNPFNPVTHFRVDLPKATEVEVAVYDLLGRKIASLLSGSQAAGQYTLEWNGRDANGMVVPTGMYLLRMSSDEFNATQKIMLMK